MAANDAGLAAHVVRARRDLAQLVRLLNDAAVITATPDAVREAAGRAIDDLRDRLREFTDVADADLPSRRWDQLRALQIDVDGLVGECLSLAGGAVLRDRGVDAGMCAIADAMLQEIIAGLPITWEALTVPGEEERTSYRTGVIGLRCPSDAFWSLPVAVHEMGHVIAQTMVERDPGKPPWNPVRTMLAVGGGGIARREELFADFFATYALGPAYPAAMLHSRFRPQDGRPSEELDDRLNGTATHPTVDKRAHLMFEVLARMDATAGYMRHPYRLPREHLVASWTAQTRSVDVLAELTDQSRKQLRALADRYWELMTTRLRGARHSSPGEPLRAYLRADTNAEPPDAGQLRVRDVVTAAWAVRCAGDESGDAPEVEARAMALIRALMAAPAARRAVMRVAGGA